MIALPTLDPFSLPAFLRLLDRLGLAHRQVDRPDQCLGVSGVILVSGRPFQEGAAWLRRHGWWRELPHFASEGIPLLAFDGAMHLMAEGSEEAPRESGLGFLPGFAHRLGPGVKVPHLGWTQVRQHQLLGGLPDPEGSWLYFQHSHALEPDASTAWEARHGRPFAVLSARGRMIGCQALLAQSGPHGRLMLQRMLRACGILAVEDAGGREG